LRKALDATRFDRSVLPQSVGSLILKNGRCGDENLAAIQVLASRIKDEFGCGAENSVLAGDGAVLSGLHQDLSAFPVAHLSALLQDGTYVNGTRWKKLGAPVNDWSETTQFGASLWRRPKPVLLITLLASHVGNPAAPPTPPMWTHLGRAILMWRDQVSAQEVLALGRALEVTEDAVHGLAIISHIFPEIQPWTMFGTLKIAGWEKRFAVPLAARRLVMGERE
jgi:hypothetical protein